MPYWAYTELAWLLCRCSPYTSVSALLLLGFLLRPYWPSGGGVGVPEWPEWPDTVERSEWEERRGMVAPPSCWLCGGPVAACGWGSVPYCCPRLVPFG
jgi:hypothetical protein